MRFSQNVAGGVFYAAGDIFVVKEVFGEFNDECREFDGVIRAGVNRNNLLGIHGWDTADAV